MRNRACDNEDSGDPKKSELRLPRGPDRHLNQAPGGEDLQQRDPSGQLGARRCRYRVELRRREHFSFITLHWMMWRAKRSSPVPKPIAECDVLSISYQ